MTMSTTSPTATTSAPSRRRAWATCLAAVGVVATVLLLSSPSSAAPPQLPTGQATVSGTVWNDLDGDGIHDAGEPGRSGVTLHLVSGGAFQAFATTAGDGTYAFTGVPAPLAFTLAIDAPTGFSFSPQHVAGASAATDSDVEPDGSVALSLEDGQAVTFDAGVFDPTTTTTTTTTTSTSTTTSTTLPTTTTTVATATTTPQDTVPATTSTTTTVPGSEPESTTAPATTVASTTTAVPAVVAGDEVTRDPGTGSAVLATATTRTDAELARTGASTGPALALGLLLIAVGTVLAAVSRSRTA